MKAFFLFIFAVLLVSVGCVTVDPHKQPKRIEVEMGRTIPFYAFSVDADYDPRLDGLIPGYKLLPVVLRNLALRGFPMDAKKDQWVIIGEKGQHTRALNSLRLKDPIAWRNIPEKMRSIIDYPEVVPINYSVTFDLLFPPKAQIEYFKELRYYNAYWGKEFRIKKEY